MKIKIIFFASLSDFTGRNEMELENCHVVSQVIENLNLKFSGLSKLNFAIAVNKSIVGNNHPLSNGDVVALMPPFSGG